ncbi:MAG: iron-sulfur cluster-binding protein [Rhodomicrobium sp.]|nr:MAG: iron-sulfur cluster-binding protein [Rhodomicrobium sp.]
MQEPIENLKNRAHQALGDEKLKAALSVIPEGFVNKRLKAKAARPDFSALSDRAVEIKKHTLENITHYLERFEHAVSKAGGTVHFAQTPDQARQIIEQLCKERSAKRIVKGKSMISEEINLAPHLIKAGYECIETDLGEYLIQLRGEMPSHIVAPAVHLTRDDIRQDFQTAHDELPIERALETPEDFVKEARGILREKFLNADIGITGANFLIAENGKTVIVTNEGNGDLCQSLPQTHIVISSFEKLVPTMEDAMTMLRLLARSATGQPISTYTTFTGGPALKKGELGPTEFHVVLLDNGRSRMLGSDYSEMLRCIRCGACLNHCPVYQNLGGHAYGSVYPGPMGAVLSPQFFGRSMLELSHASSFCGRCNEVCPVQIPLTKLMRKWRAEGRQKPLPLITMKLWAWLAAKPALYNWAMRLALPIAAKIAGSKSGAKHLPGLAQWTHHRTAPSVSKQSFQSQWAKSEKAGET